VILNSVASYLNTYQTTNGNSERHPRESGDLQNEEEYLLWLDSLQAQNGKTVGFRTNSFLAERKIRLERSEKIPPFQYGMTSA